MSNFHEKLMGFNEAMKIRKCNIHGPEKRFMGFSEVFHGIFMNLQLVVHTKLRTNTTTKTMEKLR